MEFSVLISVYYKENSLYLRQSLDSVINQTIRPTEIVIVKDGPLTECLDSVIFEYCNKYSNLFKIININKNVGLGKALEQGIKSCKYDLIARMDSDDICKFDRFEKQLKQFKKQPELDIVGSYIEEFNENINDLGCIRKVPVYDTDIKKYIKKRNPFNHMTVMFKKKAVLDSGNYKELIYAEDYYLWGRMSIKNKKMYNIPECLVYARVGNGMYERRGGLTYFKREIKLQKLFLEMQLINRYELINNLLVRFIARSIPNRIRKKVYVKLLRK